MVWGPFGFESSGLTVYDILQGFLHCCGSGSRKTPGCGLPPHNGGERASVPIKYEGPGKVSALGHDITLNQKP